MGSDPPEVHAATVVLGHDEDVKAAQRHGVDVGEVDRKDRVGLGGQELSPGRAGSAGAGSRPALLRIPRRSKRPRCGRGRQLALDGESAWGAAAGFPQLRFPRPLSEPDVRLSPHPALHRTHAAAAITAQRCSLVCISRTRDLRCRGIRRGVFGHCSSLLSKSCCRRRVGRRRGIRVCEPFSGDPPPNRACDFHRTRLSSVRFREYCHVDDSLWISSWQSRQTIRVLRRRDAICLTHSGCAARSSGGRSFRRRMWCTSTSVCVVQSSQRPEISRPTSSARRFLQIPGSSSLRTTLVVLRASEIPPQRATSGFFPRPARP